MDAAFRRMHARVTTAIAFVAVVGAITWATLPHASAAPCECKDIPRIEQEIARVTMSEGAWKEIFAWARELYPHVSPPGSNDDLNQKFAQLMGRPKSDWATVIEEGPPKTTQKLTKVAGLNAFGEPVISEEFRKANCDEIVEAERVHEATHEKFYLSFPHFLEAGAMSSRHLRVRAESEVESYRAQKAYLTRQLDELEKRCPTLLRLESEIMATGPTNARATAFAEVPLRFAEQKGFIGHGVLLYTTEPLPTPECRLSVKGKGSTTLDVNIGMVQTVKQGDRTVIEDISFAIEPGDTTELATGTCGKAKREQETNFWSGFFNMNRFGQGLAVPSLGIVVTGWTIVDEGDVIARKEFQGDCFGMCREITRLVLKRKPKQSADAPPGGRISP
jgi:hypothetical protein